MLFRKCLGNEESRFPGARRRRYVDMYTPPLTLYTAPVM
jgi:hypothetical protein